MSASPDGAPAADAEPAEGAPAAPAASVRRPRAMRSFMAGPGLRFRMPDWHAGPRAPDAICVGAPKCGTTWLHLNIGRHPAVWQPPIKEVEYFSSVYLQDATFRRHRAAQIRFARDALTPREGEPTEAQRRKLQALRALQRQPVDDAWYQEIFGWAGLDQVTVESSPGYALLPRAAIRHLRELNPQARILIMLRDPVERAMSHLMMVAGEDRSEAHLRRLLASPWWHRAEAYSDYATWVPRWTGMFGPERVLIATMGEVRDAPEDLLRRVCGFLGLPFRAELFPQAARPVGRGAARGDALAALRAEVAERLAPVIAGLEETMPELAERLRRQG